MIYPSSHTMLGRWIPPLERGRASAFVYSGTSLGTVATMAGVGLLAASSWGWPSGFHVPGALGLVWGVAWLWLARPGPEIWILMACCLPVIPLSVWAGWRLHGRLDQRQLYRICYGLLIVTALKLLWDGASGLAAN